MTHGLLRNRKQDKSQPFADIFICHEQINIDNCAGINQFRDRISDLHDNNATGETSTSRSETAVVTAPLSPDVLLFPRWFAPFSTCGIRRRVRHANASRRRTSRGTFRVMRIHIGCLRAALFSKRYVNPIFGKLLYPVAH